MRTPIRSDSPATQQFLDDLSDAGFAASDLGGQRAKAGLSQIAAAVAARKVSEISSADPDQVQLTDDQWARLAKETRVMASFSSDSW